MNDTKKALDNKLAALIVLLPSPLVFNESEENKKKRIEAEKKKEGK